MSVPFTDDTIFWPKILELVQCVAREWVDASLPEPCFLGILPGDFAPNDYCNCNEGGECGQVWVRLQLIIEQENPNGTAVGGLSNACATPLLAQVEVGHLMCAPMPKTMADGSVELPSVTEQLDAARQSYASMAALARAIRCCYASKKDIGSMSYVPYGPAGGCLGGSWTVTIAGD